MEKMKPFIVAECGSNWQSLDDCKASIIAAKQAGADAVKFQMFTEEELYGFPRPNPYSLTEPCYDIFQGMAELDLKKKFEADRNKNSLPRDWIPTLAEKAKATGIDFMCTAFSPSGYLYVNDYVKRHKVASSEMCHKRILETLRDLKKPVILSTGAQSLPDIKYALDVLGKEIDVTVLYCEASYPANWVDLRTMHTMAFALKKKVGFSDHTTSVIEIPRNAALMGAVVIEKHFKVREMDTPDAPHSILPHEFKAMVQAITEDIAPQIGPTPAESGMITKHKRRLIAIKHIAVGDTLVEGENFGIYRSLVDDTKALHPFLVDQIAGKRAKVEIQAGEGISPGSFE